MQPLAPTFPGYIVAGTFLILLPVTLRAFFHLETTPARFLLGVIWLRHLMSALHQYTYPPIAGGMSLNAIASVVVTVIGLLIIDKRLLTLKAIVIIYLMVAVLLASAIFNARIDAIGSFAKWGYLIALTTVAYSAFRQEGSVTLFSALLTAFLPPFALQLLSVYVGLGKGSEDDGSLCFIGGFNHEGGFSIIVMTFLYCACFLESKRPKLTAVCMAAGLCALALANYRTSLLAALPMFAGTIFFGSVRRFSPTERPLAVIVICLAGTAVLYVAAVAMRDRFGDLLVILSRSAELIKPPEYYTEADADLLSSRLILWSRYITAYVSGSAINLALGFGPEAWDGVFSHYAHNTFVSVLYEAGILGLVCMIMIFAFSFKLALGTSINERPLIICAHTGFFILNLATMPLWMIEGNVLFALTLAYTLYMRARLKTVVS